MNTAGLPSRTCLTLLYPYLARYALLKNYYYILYCISSGQPYLLIRDARTMTFSNNNQKLSWWRVTTLNCIYRSHLFAALMRSFLPTLKRRSLYLCLSSSEIPLMNTVEPLLPGETGTSTCMNEKNHLIHMSYCALVVSLFAGMYWLENTLEQVRYGLNCYVVVKQKVWEIRIETHSADGELLCQSVHH